MLASANETPLQFNDQTIRMIARISKGGDQIRVRFENTFGDTPLVIGAAHVAIHAGSGTTVDGTDRTLTFGGEPGITVPTGAPALSDPVELTVDDLSELAISLYLPNPTPAVSGHSLGLQTTYVSSAGDNTAATSFPTQTTSLVRYFLSGVEVEAQQNTAAIITLGNSITDGFASTVDTNNRWPDKLAERLSGARGGHNLAVVNEGISGNRVLNDQAGPNALSRFDRDVLAQPGAAFVTVLEGVNDIGFPQLGDFRSVSADEIIQGYRQLIVRAHSKCLKIIGATITPYEGALYYTEEGEAKRQAVNAFIRNSGEFDAVIDFDQAIRDPDQQTRFLPAYDSGDNLHPSDAGYDAMAQAIDLSIFRQRYDCVANNDNSSHRGPRRNKHDVSILIDELFFNPIVNFGRSH